MSGWRGSCRTDLHRTNRASLSVTQALRLNLQRALPRLWKSRTEVGMSNLYTRHQPWSAATLLANGSPCHAAQAVRQCGVAAAGAGGADGDGEGLAGTDEDNEPFGPGDRGVEQVAL